MATYYVSPNGSDANNGLGPDASAGTNKPWLTIGKALGAAGIASGDTVYIAPGIYRESVAVAMTSAVATTNVFGDPANAQSFKDGSGVLLAAGPVRWTAWGTDDKTAPAANKTLELQGRDFLTFQDISFMGSTGAVACISSAVTGAATDITFRRCLIVVPPGNAAGLGINVSSTGSPANIALNWTIDSCIIFSGSSQCITVNPASSASADFDLNFVIKNSVLRCSGGNNQQCVQLSKSGAAAFLGGGMKVSNCTLFGIGVKVTTAGSTTFPCTIYNSLIWTDSTIAALVGVTTGDILENFNIILAAVARTNVTAGGSSQTAYAPIMELGQSALWGFLPRPPFSPTIDSPMLGFGTDASVSLTADMLGRDRPSGPGITWANILKSVGALEFHNFARKEATVTDSGDGWKLTGPGDQAIDVPVDATSTVITIKTRYDTNHATTNKPQAELLAAPELGITGEIKTATVGVDTWETLTFTSFTASTKGWVRILVRSRAAAGNGLAYFDTITVT